MVEGGEVIRVSSMDPKIGEDWKNDAVGTGIFGIMGGAVVVASGTVALPAILGVAAVGAGAYASVVGVKRLYYWVTDR